MRLDRRDAKGAILFAPTTDFSVMPNRQDLRLQLFGAEAALSAPGMTSPASWDAVIGPIVAAASPHDAAWLDDQIVEMERRRGLGFETAEQRRLLESRGLCNRDDEAPAPGPYPLFVAMPVSRVDGGDVGESLVHFEMGGVGPYSWGPAAEGDRVWLSDARPGGTVSEAQPVLWRIAAELALLGIQIDADLASELTGPDANNAE